MQRPFSQGRNLRIGESYATAQWIMVSRSSVLQNTTQAVDIGSADFADDILVWRFLLNSSQP